ncbi:MAG: aldo/keto reductase [Phycisphaerae bacterium]|nr:aldo/keto reductase [Phycisphaerae bacterium]
MQYRRFGKTGIKVSALGFGAMRLPIKSGKSNEKMVDEKLAIAMIRRAIDEGVNYVDTAYVYHEGHSERVTGLALLDGYRQKVQLATKSPLWLLEKRADFGRILDEQLKKLQTDTIDFYLLHAIQQDSWEVVLQYDLLTEMERAKKAGKIGHIGFSFHDKLPVFKQIIDHYPHWDFCQIQLNVVNTVYQAGLEGLRYAAARDIGVVIMEPLRGGYLANVPPAVRDILAPTGKPAVEWALDFLWDMPEVSLLISGMSTMQHVNDNLLYANRSSPGMLSAADQQVIQRVQEQYKSYQVIPCTGCDYCLPCPQGVAIPYNFTPYNEYQTLGDLAKSKKAYHDWVTLFGELANKCTGCQQCESLCPQQIKISQWLPKVHALLG